MIFLGTIPSTNLGGPCSESHVHFSDFSSNTANNQRIESLDTQ